MAYRKPPLWNIQPGLVARPWRAHWRGAKAVFPFLTAGGGGVYPLPVHGRWALNNNAAMAVTEYGPAVYFDGTSQNEVETTADPIRFASGEPYTVVFIIRWLATTGGTQHVFRDGAASTGGYFSVVSSNRLWGRHSNSNAPASGSGLLLTVGRWYLVARTWDGSRARQYVNGTLQSSLDITDTDAWELHRFGHGFTSGQELESAQIPFFGAFGSAWDDAMVARWSGHPLGMLWPETDTAFVTSGGGNGGPPAAPRRPVIIIASS